MASLRGQWLGHRARGIYWRLLGYGGLALMIATVGAPIFWMITGSIKTNQEIYTFPPVWWPERPVWENYTTAWNAAPFGRFYLNTLITTAAGVGLELLNATLSAYALVFLRFPKKNLIFVLLLVALMIPNQVTILPNYITLSDIFGHSWINTY